MTDQTETTAATIYLFVFLVFGLVGFVLLKKGMPKGKKPSGYLLFAGWLALVLATLIPVSGFIFHP